MIHNNACNDFKSVFLVQFNVPPDVKAIWDQHCYVSLFAFSNSNSFIYKQMHEDLHTL